MSEIHTLNQLFVPSSDVVPSGRPEVLWRYRRVLGGTPHRLKAIRKLFLDGKFSGICCIMTEKRKIVLFKSHMDPFHFLDVVEGRLPDDTSEYELLKLSMSTTRPRMGMVNLSLLSQLNRVDVVWDPDMYNMFEKNIKGYVRPKIIVPEIDPTCLPFLPAQPQFVFSKFELPPSAGVPLDKKHHFPLKMPSLPSGHHGSHSLPPTKEGHRLLPPCISGDMVSCTALCIEHEILFDVFKMSVCNVTEAGVRTEGSKLVFDPTAYVLSPWMTSPYRINGESYRRRFKRTSIAKEHSSCFYWKIFLEGGRERVLPFPRAWNGNLDNYLDFVFGKSLCDRHR